MEEIVQDPLGPVLTVAGALKGTEEASVGFDYLLLHPSSALPAGAQPPGLAWLGSG